MMHEDGARGVPISKCIVCKSQFNQKEEEEEKARTAEDDVNEQAEIIINEKKKMKKLQTARTALFSFLAQDEEYQQLQEEKALSARSEGRKVF